LNVKNVLVLFTGFARYSENLLLKGKIEEIEGPFVAVFAHAHRPCNFVLLQIPFRGAMGS
jgi:hypothetical protein